MVCDAASQLTNTTYNGVYQVEGDNVYTLLNQYDLLLLPTRWKAEGVPGVLVEGKIAGLPAIVSDINYNAEIVEHGVSGFVLDRLNADAMVKAIRIIDEDRSLLTQLKQGALQSAEAYMIDKYIDEILRQIG